MCLSFARRVDPPRPLPNRHCHLSFGHLARLDALDRRRLDLSGVDDLDKRRVLRQRADEHP